MHNSRGPNCRMHPGQNNLPTPDPAKIAAAEYIAVEMSRLARMASANEFPLLPYLIDMAVLEAWREASEPPGAQGRASDAK